MKNYSQKDPRWSWKRIGTCRDTIGQSGCKIDCYGMFAEMRPDEVNIKLIAYDGYVRGCLTVDSKCAEILGLRFSGRVKYKPDYSCIAETNYYKKQGVPQHFFVMLKDGRIIDPLDFPAKPTKNKYYRKVVSYRLFKPKEDITIKPKPVSTNKSLIKALSRASGINLGDEINEKKELPRLLEWLNSVALLSDRVRTLEREIAGLKKERASLQRQMSKGVESYTAIKLFQEAFKRILSI